MPEVQNINPLKYIYYSQKNFNNKVILLADTFNINFEIHNLIYAIKVLNKFDNGLRGNPSHFYNSSVLSKHWFVNLQIGRQPKCHQSC